MSLTNEEVLEVFVESVDELIESKYLQEAKAGSIGSPISILKGVRVVMERSAPDRDSLKAALLTIRFFCQDNERTSLRNMEALVQGLPIRQLLKERFSRARADFNTHRQMKPSVTYPAGIGADTNGDIFDTFLYGEFAHANPQKRRLIKSWKDQPYFDDLRSQFDLTLLLFLSTVVVMRNIVAEILAVGPLPKEE